MSTTSNKLIDFIKNIQHSLFMWFLLSYGTMYLIGIFTTKNIYSKFEEDFTQSIAAQILENRIKNIEYTKDYFNFNNIYNLLNYISHINENGINIYSIITLSGSKNLQIDNGIIWTNINWKLINLCANKSLSCKKPIMRAYDLGLDHKYENYYVYASIMEIDKIKYININLTSPSKIIAQHLKNIRSTEHLSQFIIFLSFICYIFISYGAVRPVSMFVRRMRKQKLDSENFEYGERNELNHVRYIRSTIYEALVRKEQEEKERLSMQNTLLSQQKEAEIGKIVSQISHDLKSPLIIFEDILRENSYENFNQNFEAARRSLNKIFSLVYSLKQADKESLITRELSYFSVEGIIEECGLYAKTRNLYFENSINLPSHELLLDQQKVERSINNLLRNAVEYAKSKVILNIDLVEDNLIIQICDDGEGVDAEVLPRLFQWRNTGNLESGTGIGLYYAKQIALAHGGDVIYSQEYDLTIFTLNIPGVIESNTVQTYTLTEPSAPGITQHYHGASSKKFVVFFIKSKEKYDSFYEFMSQKQLSCVFFNELSEEYEETRCLVLYTDTSEAILEDAIDNGVHIILSKETDTPQAIYDRLIRSYPTLLQNMA